MIGHYCFSKRVKRQLRTKQTASAPSDSKANHGPKSWPTAFGTPLGNLRHITWPSTMCTSSFPHLLQS
eukprot:4940082-Amphidinium_carterae.1